LSLSGPWLQCPAFFAARDAQAPLPSAWALAEAVLNGAWVKQVKQTCEPAASTMGAEATMTLVGESGPNNLFSIDCFSCFWLLLLIGVGLVFRFGDGSDS
jgi:hypothetical protein